MRVLTKADRAAIATYCFYYAKFNEAKKEMEKEKLP
jgi:phage terminase small subunit